MTRATIVGCGAVIVGMLLATVTSVSAFHVATGKGTYAVDPHVVAEFHFVVAKPGGQNPALKPGLNVVQSELTRVRSPMSFQTTMISTATDFTIPPESTETDVRTVTITGELVSTTFLGMGAERQAYAELVPFTAIGVDTVTPDADTDSFSLILTYSADPDKVQGQLFQSLGFGECDATTCTITFRGSVKRGNIFVHTSGDE